MKAAREKNSTRAAKAALLILGLHVAMTGQVKAEAVAFTPFSMTNVQFSYGSGFEFFESDELKTLVLEHYSTWRHGDNYFFVDLYRSGNSETFYGEWCPSISLNRAMGVASYGIVKNAHILGCVNVGDDFRAYQLGAGVDLQLPGVDFFRLNAYAYFNETTGDESWQVSPIWDTTVAINEQTHLRLRGYADIVGKGSGGSHYILADPQALLDVGNLLNLQPRQFYAGLEYRYWNNKFGVEGVDEHVGQVMAAWFF